MRLETASLISFGQSLIRLIYKRKIFADEKSGTLESQSNNIGRLISEEIMLSKKTAEVISTCSCECTTS